jgi:hypothetical protein
LVLFFKKELLAFLTGTFGGQLRHPLAPRRYFDPACNGSAPHTLKLHAWRIAATPERHSTFDDF